MNNSQLYTAIAIPSVLVVLAWITFLIQNNKLDSKIERSTDSLRADLRADRKELIDKMDKLGDSIHSELKDFFKMITDVESRTTRLEERK